MDGECSRTLLGGCWPEWPICEAGQEAGHRTMISLLKKQNKTSVCGLMVWVAASGIFFAGGCTVLCCQGILRDLVLGLGEIAQPSSLSCKHEDLRLIP